MLQTLLLGGGGSNITNSASGGGGIATLQTLLVGGVNTLYNITNSASGVYNIIHLAVCNF